VANTLVEGPERNHPHEIGGAAGTGLEIILTEIGGAAGRGLEIILTEIGGVTLPGALARRACAWRSMFLEARISPG
jgi:hypothetical protein